ncbi:apoptosis-associated speck-like protein containing a CARD [Channa argus]|uniref:apoptosis-associated speck-like protein containing a CARD n=1 Tax=Channa argus TaxID=215402 RepID=UPI00294812D4|nr:hypothetical protein Q8A73_007609 [Channa argus]
MAPKTIRTALAETLEDLSKQNFEKFCHQLLDRREGPRVRRNRVEGKNFLDVADVVVSTFTEAKAVGVVMDILRQIDCNEDAESLAKLAGVQSGDAAGSGGATGNNTRAEGGCSTKHFVDKHKVELIKRVSNIAPILDELLYKDVIQEEVYDKIRAIRTPQDKMRELFSGPLKASVACKDAFYKILEKNEPYLIKDLKENN